MSNIVLFLLVALMQGLISPPSHTDYITINEVEQYVGATYRINYQTETQEYRQAYIDTMDTACDCMIRPVPGNASLLLDYDSVTGQPYTQLIQGHRWLISGDHRGR